MDVDEHSLGIDVWDLEMGAFLEPQFQGVDGCEADLVAVHFDGFQDSVDLVLA